MIAYSGFLYVANSVNPSGISQAKSILIHTVVGIVIALAAWMIVDAVMAALYNQSLGTWSTLVKGDGHVPCVPQAGVAANTYSQATGAGPNGGGTTAPKSDARTLTQLNAPDGACNPVTVENAFLASSPHNAPVATPSQAKFLACIAQGESTCGQLLQNFNWGKLVGTGLSAKASSAYGPYQVLLASNHECYEYAACYVAAGLPADGSTKLDCQNAFEANGMPIAGPLLDKCKLAAGNKQCSATAAVCLLNKQSISKAYGTDPYVASCQAASQ
jgi:hypothetical protein